MAVATLLRAGHIGVKELKTHLSQVLKVERPWVVTDRGQPTRFLLPYDDVVELVEMLEELSDRATLRRVAAGRRAVIRKTRGVPVATLWRNLGVT